MTQSPHRVLTQTHAHVHPGPAAARALAPLLAQIGGVMAGQAAAIRLAVCCLLAGGHLLIEDLPGLGKTTLARALARSLGLPARRVAFTADLMPADLLGGSVYDRGSGDFRFLPGPVFSPVLLADEINRAGPRTQGALLEAMEERQVSLDGQTHALPAPFFVIATQNPADQLGTYPLPESQLDRFLMCLRLGYPEAAAERDLLAGEDRRGRLDALAPALTPAALAQLQAAVPQVQAAAPLLDHLLALLQATRRDGPDSPWRHGLSPRAGLAWLRAARAWALLEGRTHLLPDDLHATAVPVLTHRLAPREPAGSAPTPLTSPRRAERVRALLRDVPLA